MTDEARNGPVGGRTQSGGAQRNMAREVRCLLVADRYRLDEPLGHVMGEVRRATNQTRPG